MEKSQLGQSETGGPLLAASSRLWPSSAPTSSSSDGSDEGVSTLPSLGFGLCGLVESSEDQEEV